MLNNHVNCEFIHKKQSLHHMMQFAYHTSLHLY